MKNGYCLFCLFALILSSCNVAYRANIMQTPLFSGKNELAITAARSNLQLAYSVTDHIGIMANGYYESSEISRIDVGNGGTGYLGEVGAGYFTPISESDLIFETYAGLGLGHLSLENHYRNASNDIDIRTLEAGGIKAFIQPAIGYRRRFFELSAGLRYSNVNYYNARFENWSAGQREQDGVGGIGNTTFHFIEPALTVRAGLRNIKFQFQYLHCFKLNSEPLNYSAPLFTLGIFFKFPTSGQPRRY